MAESVIVCMPVYDKVHPQAWDADMAVMAELARAFPKGRLAVQSTARLTQPHAENTMIRRARKMGTIDGQPFDWLLWIEDDTLPPPTIFADLRAHASLQRPVVHGLSFDREPPYDPSIWEYVTEEGEQVGIRPIRDWMADSLYYVAHSGLCGSLFHMSVWDRLSEPWFHMRPSQGAQGGLSPCMSLSMRFREAGVPMLAFTGCIVPHIGEPLIVDGEFSKAFQAAHQAELPDGVGRFLQTEP